MSTVITRILQKLNIGRSEVGHIATDDRGNNVWTWDDEEAQNAATKTALLRKLDNSDLGMADTTMWKKASASKKPPADESVETYQPPVTTDHELRIVESPSKKAADPARKQNRFGKPTDSGGGFNPYG